MPIYLVRHGETRLSGTYCGSTNPPLTRRGRAQAGAVARHLKRFPVGLLYSSPLLRARQTAMIIQRHLKIPLVTKLSLREMHFGAWEGLRFADIEKKWPTLAKRWSEDPMTVRIPHAEPFPSLRRRIKRFLAFIRKPLMNENILVVAHGGALSAIVLELFGLPDKDFLNHVQPPGSICLIQGRTMRTLC